MENLNTSFRSLKDIQIENYTLISEIGQGGYGVVYKAKQESTNQIVAIKTVQIGENFNQDKKERQIERFERETSLCAEINHPNIVKLLDKGSTSEGVPFAVFEYVSGETLKELIVQEPKLKPEEIGELMGQVLDALACAHEKGIVHRDLKPGNIMCMKSGTKRHVKILDFGISTLIQEVRTEAYEALTISQDFVGTPIYSAPEQLRGEPPTIKSDFYAWGLILIECFTGTPVIKGQTIAEVFQEHLSPVSLAMPAGLAGHPLANLLSRVIDKDPVSRLGEANAIFEEYKKINFTTLADVAAIVSPQEEDDTDMTAPNSFIKSQVEKRQITVLAIRLNLVTPKEKKYDLELLDTVQKDQLHRCQDTVVKYGGAVVNTVTNTIVAYFGYPNINENDARRAGRTTLELINDVQKRSALLFQQHGIKLNISIGLNTGEVLLQHQQVPEGMVPNLAFELLFQTKPNTAIASQSTKRLLENYLEFEAIGGETSLEGEPLFLLVGERATEAYSFLNSDGNQIKIIGRKKEIDLIESNWHSPEQNTFFIHGVAGIGKSKFISTIKEKLKRTTQHIVECRFLPENQNSALFPFLSLLKKKLNVNVLSNEQVIHEIENLVNNIGESNPLAIPILCSWLSIPYTAEYSLKETSPEQQKELLFSVFEHVILPSVGESKPLVIIEDIHWAGATSLEFLNKLVQRVQDKEAMLLMTSRESINLENEESKIQDLELDILDESETRAFLDTYLSHPVKDNVVDYIATRTDGVPLFIEELVQMMLSEKYLYLMDNEYSLIENIKDQEVPITLKELLNSSLSKLGLAKETSQLASVMGREFNYDALIKTSLKDEALVQADILELINARIIYRQRNIKNEKYIFRHALLRDAAYDSIIDSNKKQLHTRFAHVLEDDFTEVVEASPFVLAQHFGKGEWFDKATEYGVKSMRQLSGKGLNIEANSLLTHVNEWLDKIEKENVRLHLKLQLNDVMIAVYLNTEGYGTVKFAELYEENKKLKDKIEGSSTQEQKLIYDELLLRSGCLYLNHLHISNQRVKAWEISKGLIDGIEKLQDYRLRMLIRASMGQMYLCDGKLEEAEKSIQLVIKEGLERKDYSIFKFFGFDPVAMSYGNLASVYALRGDYKKAMELTDTATEYAFKVNNPGDIIVSFVFKGLLLGLFEEKEKAKKLMADIHSQYGEMLASSWVSGLLLFIGDWVNGETEQSAGVRQGLIDANQDALLTWYELLMVDTMMSNKKFKEAYELLLQTEKRVVEKEERSLRPIVYAKLGECYYEIHQKLDDQLRNYFEKDLSDSTTWLEVSRMTSYTQILFQNDQHEALIAYAKPYTGFINQFVNDNIRIGKIYQSLKSINQYEHEEN